MTDWTPEEFGFETLAIHAGQEPDPAYGAVTTPIYQTSTYAQSAAGEHKGYDYSRSGNPTRTALETCLAALEHGTAGIAFASGMAAEDCLLRTLLAPGDHVVIPDDAYGGTYRLFDRVARPWGLTFTPAPVSDTRAVIDAWTPQTKLLWVETPTNPTLGIADLTALASVARERGALLVVDNTFASPYLQQPLTLGADVVVHSATKYLGGHSDVVGGAVVLRDTEVAERLRYAQNAMGGVPGAFDAWLVLRGVKTLGVRMRQHCANAQRVVEMLSAHAGVARVLYPGLPKHPGHELAAKQMRDFGGMVSFIAADGEDAALEIVRRTKVFTLAESLGGVESLIEHPARMTHLSVAGSPLAVDPALVRLSVGIEDADDLIDDLAQALG
ncbi:MAG: cystathionine gamma-synthase [Mycobacteriales bacterium]